MICACLNIYKSVALLFNFDKLFILAIGTELDHVIISRGMFTVLTPSSPSGVMPDTSAGMMARCRRAGVEFVSSKSIPDMVKEKDVSDTVDRIFRVKKHFTIIDVNANQQYTPPV